MIVGAIPIKKISTRYPHKNFKRFNGEYLIHLAIRRLEPFVDMILISTDSVDEVQDIVNEIKDTCRTKVLVNERSPNLSVDGVGSEQPIREVIQRNHVPYDAVVVMTQITSPTIKQRTIERAMCEFVRHKPDMLTTVTPDYRPTGGAYVFKAQYLKTCESIYDGRVGLLLISYEEGLDIDYLYQLRIAEAVELGRIT